MINFISFRFQIFFLLFTRIHFITSNQTKKKNLRHFLGQVLPYSLEEVLCVEVHVWLHILDTMDATSQILGHESRVDRIHARFLQRLAEQAEFVVSVKLGPVFQTSGPGEDGGYWVGFPFGALGSVW